MSRHHNPTLMTGISLLLPITLTTMAIVLLAPVVPKLMEEFAKKDGVAAYVFAGDETPEEEAASIDALAHTKNKNFRQRRLTQSNRTMQSSLQRLLNRSMDNSHQQILH